MSKNAIQKVTLGCRLFLGLVFFVFGLNGFLNFIPVPPEMPEKAMKMMQAFMESGYFMQVVKGTEVIGGLMLLTGRFAPLGLIILAPVTVQIFLFHAFTTPGLQNLIMPLFMIMLHLGAAHLYRDRFIPLLKP
ncbi:MAG: DoxX family membrane protein [Deltaproteobacteria bacterium]|jgi:putative oxidoreductase|nr:DoxX family membrane protein [Deltaproteobacteria bacterium]